MNINPSENFVTQILKKITPIIGAELLLEPDYQYTGMITFKNGKKVFYRNTRFNINPLGSVEVAKDKNYASFFLKHFGFNVPYGQSFFSENLNTNLAIKRTIDDGYEYAKKIGFPVILKPNNLSQGLFVTKVYGKTDYYKTAKKILKNTAVMIVERFYEGNDFRIVVLDDKIISAYQRIPLKIIGNGQNTVRELLELKQQEFEKTGRDTIIDFEDDRIARNLKRKKITFDTIIYTNEVIQLLDNANLSTGGTSHDFTASIHEEYAKLAIEITKSMCLRLCGVDILTPSITEPLNEYVIIEINSAPGLDNYAAMGEAQNQIVENLYMQILLSIENS